MGLLVEARQMSAIGADGMLFTSVSTTIRMGQVAVVSGPPDLERTALLLALCGRLALAGGSLRTDPDYGDRPAAVVLRDRIAVAQAAPWITLDPHLRVCEAITERRLLCGNGMTVAAVRDACTLMQLDLPPLQTSVRDLDPVERLLLTVALAAAQHADAVAVADADTGFGIADRDFVRQALHRLTAAGKAVVATAADGGWGDVDIRLSAQSPDDGSPDGSDGDGEAEGDAGRDGDGEAAGDEGHDAATPPRPLPLYVHRAPGGKPLGRRIRRAFGAHGAAKKGKVDAGADPHGARREAEREADGPADRQETGDAAEREADARADRKEGGADAEGVTEARTGRHEGGADAEGKSAVQGTGEKAEGTAEASPDHLETGEDKEGDSLS
ncbi:hypothetical protein ACFV6B_39075 [Streptomyces microflavus]|uniref:hypothetical protein n=1 Tax=Streptomyces microflavus TaxID=1919 RepID=UPI00364E1355